MARTFTGFAVAVFGVAAASSALAHHSYAMFDRDRTDSLVGVVKDFQIINPHSWLEIDVPDRSGRAVEWSLEMGGAGQMARAGWSARSVQPGDKITVRLHPLRDGSNGGQVESVTLANGQRLDSGLPRGRGG